MAGTPPHTTLLLDRTVWDLVLDTAGNIALAAPPYAVAQDAASEIRTFVGEIWYDTVRGLPYFADILGQKPPIQLMRSAFNAAALKVPGTTAARTFITGIVGRQATGQVQVTDVNGRISVAGF